MAVHVWPPFPSRYTQPSSPLESSALYPASAAHGAGPPLPRPWPTLGGDSSEQGAVQGPSLRTHLPEGQGCQAPSCGMWIHRDSAFMSAPGCPGLTALPKRSVPRSPLCRWESMAFPRHSSSISSVWGRTTPSPTAKQTSQWRTSSFYIIFTTLFKHRINRQRLMIEICIVSWLTDLSLPTQLDPSPLEVRSTTELRLGPPARMGWGCGGEKGFPGPAQPSSHSSQEVAWGELDGAGNTT